MGPGGCHRLIDASPGGFFSSSLTALVSNSRQTAARAAVLVVSSILAISLSLVGRISRISLLGLASKVFQLIKAGSALSDVGEQGGELSVRGRLREFQQDIAPWTGDALRIGKVFMHDPVKRVEQLFFEVHAAMPQLNMESKPDCHVAVSRIPRSMIGVDENLCVHSPIVPTDAAAYPNLAVSMTATAPI